MRALACGLALIALTVPAAAGGDVPKSPHPRLLLDAATRAAWKAQAGKAGTPVARAVDRCGDIRDRPKELGRDLYMGLDWARNLQSCLVAWAATGKAQHGDTAMTYFVAMLDDLAEVGDAKGGDGAARRDSGFAIRAMGPYTALAYDWLHDYPKMTEALRARARKRFAAWTTWYLASGYRARSPSTNYHAGYLIAATFIAIAQNGEAGAAGDALWRLVRDELWGKDMNGALQPGGILDGGDWGEGWQYAPLSVVEYATAARAMAQQGVVPDRIGDWLDDVIRRHVHALSPGAGLFVGGDTQATTANLPPSFLTLAAVIIGAASPTSQAWAADEIARLKLTGDEWQLFSALAAASGVKPAPVPRDRWPTAYLARGVNTFFTRSHWGADGVWAVLQCNRTIDADHVHPDAGNLVVSRGADDVIVDPSPYGTLSSLTGNAPTVQSSQFPADYGPSQAFWSVKTGFAWARQARSGIIAARCDYADQYKFQDNPSDVPRALRDVVVVPWNGGRDATIVVVDRAESGDKGRPLHLRFRTLAKLARDGELARGSVGKSSLTIQRLWSSGGKPETRSLPEASCFDDGVIRGGCDKARFPVDEWRLVVPGPTMEAADLIDVGPAGAKVSAANVERKGAVSVVTAERGGERMAVVVGGSGTITYRAPAASHQIVLDAPADAAVTAAVAKGGCTVTVGASGGTKLSGQPALFALDAKCAVIADPEPPARSAADLAASAEAAGAGATAGAEAAAGTDEPDDAAAPPEVPTPSPRSPRSGCCGAQAAPGSSLAASAIVAAWWLLRRRRRV